MKQVVRAYTSRMQIEESFRDLKSERFGLGYDASRSTRTVRCPVNGGDPSGTVYLIARIARQFSGNE
jgi:hypothetical protein